LRWDGVGTVVAYPVPDRRDRRLVWSNLRSGCKPCRDVDTAPQVAAGHRGVRAGRRK